MVTTMVAIHVDLAEFSTQKPISKSQSTQIHAKPLFGRGKKKEKGEKKGKKEKKRGGKGQKKHFLLKK